MKISLTQIKNVLMEVRDSAMDGDEFDLAKFIVELSPKTLNTICSEITGIKNVNYAGNLFGDGEGDNFEEGAIEIVSDFLLSILNSYKRSKSFRGIMAMFLPPKMIAMMEQANQLLKSEQS